MLIYKNAIKKAHISKVNDSVLQTFLSIVLNFFIRSIITDPRNISSVKQQGNANTKNNRELQVAQRVHNNSM